MMKYEDAEAERNAELRLSLQALHGRNQLLESQALSLELMQQQGHGLSIIEQQLLLQQQQQLLHAQALMQSVQHTQDTLALSSPPGLAIGGAEAAAFGDSALLDSSAFARQQQRASAADHWREKKRRQAQLQEGKQSGSDPESEAAPARVGPTSAAAASASANASATAAGKGVLGAQGAKDGPRKGQSADKRKEESRRKRLLRNRVSAQQARERKRSYMQDLEKQCNDLESKNTNLEDQINALSQENDGLRQMMKRTVQARRGGAETEGRSASDGDDAQ